MFSPKNKHYSMYQRSFPNKQSVVRTGILHLVQQGDIYLQTRQNKSSF